jgi:REP element-mobilizing transposase RayT
MSRRYRIKGSIFYITTNVYNRLHIFTRPSFIIPIIDSLNYYRYQYCCKLLGYVIMPDHLHLLLWPQAVEAISDFMRDFKRFTSGRTARQARLEGNTDWLEAFERAGKETDRAELRGWQDGFWEQDIYTPKFLEQKLNYIHMNPVRAGITEAAEQYPYSSYANYYRTDHHLIEIDTDWEGNDPRWRARITQ